MLSHPFLLLHLLLPVTEPTALSRIFTPAETENLAVESYSCFPVFYGAKDIWSDILLYLIFTSFPEFPLESASLAAFQLLCGTARKQKACGLFCGRTL